MSLLGEFDFSVDRFGNRKSKPRQRVTEQQFSEPELTPEEQRSAFSEIASGTGKLIGDAFWLLDTPGAIVRSGIDYLQDGDWNSPFGEDRVYGNDILENAGWESDGLAKSIAGFGLDVITDPLAFTGINSLTRSGKAAKAIGLLDNATGSASRKLARKASKSSLDDAAREMGVGSGRAGRTLRSMGLEDKNIAQYVDEDFRPLVGTSEAQRKTSLADLINESADPSEYTKRLREYADTKQIDFDELLAEDALGSSTSFMGAAGDAFGKEAGDLIARGSDRIAEAARWGNIPLTNISPGRALAALGKKKLFGQTGSAEQALANRLSSGIDEGAAKARRDITGAGFDAERINDALTDEVKKKYGVKSIYDAEARDMIDRVIDSGGAAAMPRDLEFIKEAGLQPLLDTMTHWSDDILGRSKDAGINADRVKNLWGFDSTYRPYQLNKVSDTGRQQVKRSLFDTMTGDQLARKKPMQLPGGIDQIRYIQRTLSDRLPNWRELNDDKLGEELHKIITNAGDDYYTSRAGSQLAAKVQDPAFLQAYSKGKARALGSVLRDNPDELFNNHPLEAFTKYAMGREKAIGVANAATNLIGEKAVPMAGKVADANNVNAMKAFKQLGLKGSDIRTPELRRLKAERDLLKSDIAKLSKNKKKNAPIIKQKLDKLKKNRAEIEIVRDKPPLPDSGAGKAVQRAIAEGMRKRTGKVLSQAEIDKIDITKFQLSSDTIKQIQKLEQVYATPQSRSTLMSHIAGFTKLFRNQILLWPRRYSRDLTSGYITNLAETGVQSSMAKSYVDASNLIGGKYDQLADSLMDVRRYADIDDPTKRVKTFMQDASEVKLFGDTRASEMVELSNTDELFNLVPGSRDKSITKIAGDTLGEFRNPLNFFKNDSKLFKEGAKIADYTDKLNRMSGYIELLKQGVTPEVAGKRMLAAHVDYSSLTAAEQKIRDIVPFYTYSARISEWAIKQLLDNPGGVYGQMARGMMRANTGDDDTYVPKSIRDGIGFNLTEGEGEEPDYYLSGVDFPGLQPLGMFASERDINGTPDPMASAQETALNAVSMINPAIKTAIEMATKRDSYTGQPLSQSPTEFEQMYQRLAIATGAEDPANKWKRPDFGSWQPATDFAFGVAGGALPGLTRISNTVRDVADTEGGFTPLKNIANPLFNAVAPFRIKPVSQSQVDREMQQEIERRISQLPSSNTFTNTAISQENALKLPEKAQQLLKFHKQKMSERAKRSADRRKASVR